MTTQIRPVILPREVADAIEDFRSSGVDNQRIIDLAINGGIGPSAIVIDEWVSAGSFDTLMRALLDGYGRELTEEEARDEEFRDIYSRHGCSDSDIDNAYAAGMIQALITLGIDIPGVNIPEGGAA